MTSYRLAFDPRALRDWGKLGHDIRAQLGRKLKGREQNPRVVGSALRGMPDCYKIKLRQSGYRLVYRVKDDVLVILVIAIGKRDKDEVYDAAKARL